MKLIKKEEVAEGEISCDRRDVDDGGQRLLEHNKFCSFLYICHTNEVNSSEVSAWY